MARSLEDIKKTINTLKEVTVERGASENEAMMAAKILQNLLLKHHLELNDIEETEENKKKKIITKTIFQSKRLMWYDETLFVATNKYFLVNIFKKREFLEENNTEVTSIKAIGWEEDILIYSEFVTFVNNIMKKTFKIKCKTDPEMDRNDFYGGFIMGISKALEENKKENEDKWALVTVNEDLNKFTKLLNLRESKKSGIPPKFKNQINTFSEGYKEGKRAHDFYKNGKDKYIN